MVEGNCKLVASARLKNQELVVALPTTRPVKSNAISSVSVSSSKKSLKQGCTSLLDSQKAWPLSRNKGDSLFLMPKYEDQLKARVPSYAFDKASTTSELVSDRFPSLSKDTLVKKLSSSPEPEQMTLSVMNSNSTAELSLVPVAESLIQALKSHRGDNTLLFVDGRLLGRRCKILIDSGAQGNFVSSNFVRQSKLHTSAAKETALVTSALGRTWRCERMLSGASLTVPGTSYTDCCNFCIAPIEQDVILGMPWLCQYNPNINWQAKSLSFIKNSCKITMACALQGRPNVQLISALQVKQLVRKMNPKEADSLPALYAVYVRESPEAVSDTLSVNLAEQIKLNLQ
jgi:hypothetical protein